MPLPIGDADTAPGSPIIPESDTNAQPLIDDAELASVPPLDSTDRPGDETAGPPTVGDSGDHLDAGNQEDDEMEDELDSYPRTGSDAVVPTTIEWHGHGDNVFVTGTFVNWGRKFRLRPSENDSNVMSVVLKLREGTHHLKFIVDNVMRTSYRLPTAVDFTNHLVNYIEVVPPEPRGATERHHAPQVAAAPIVTEATASLRRAAATPGRPGTNADIVPPDVAPVNADTTTVEPVPVANRPTADQPSIVEEDEDIQPMADTRVVIPQLLEDIDVDEDTPSYQQAANVISEMTTPPTLPLFLAKSILNGHTPAKDDNSVLNYPNHTVLNHLATSSIKNGVLATSVTTRYKRKSVTIGRQERRRPINAGLCVKPIRTPVYNREGDKAFVRSLLPVTVEAPQRTYGSKSSDVRLGGPSLASVLRKDAAAGASGASNEGGSISLAELCEKTTPKTCRLNPLLFNGHLQTGCTVIYKEDVPVYYKRRVFEADTSINYEGTFAVDFVVPPEQGTTSTAVDNKDGSTQKSGDVSENSRLLGDAPPSDLPERTSYYTDAEFSRLSSETDTTPMLVVLHGLSGGSHEIYVRHILKPLCYEHKWAACVVNSRGCAQSKVTTPIMYNARATWDCRQMVEWLHKKYPKRPLFGIGFSLGANILAN
ncbi:Malate dehydrogenase, cytoplasmic, partial [Ascosphaera pollenicola]